MSDSRKTLNSHVSFSIYKSFYILQKFDCGEESLFHCEGNLQPLFSSQVYACLFSLFFLFFPISSYLFRSLFFSLSLSCVWHHLTHPPSSLPFLLLVHPHFQQPFALQHADNPSTPFKSFPSCFNLILSQAQLAQGSIITPCDQNTIYFQQLRLSKCTRGFRGETECLQASSNPYQSAFIFTPFDFALQNYNARSSPLVLIRQGLALRLH